MSSACPTAGLFLSSIFAIDDGRVEGEGMVAAGISYFNAAQTRGRTTRRIEAMTLAGVDLNRVKSHLTSRSRPCGRSSNRSRRGGYVYDDGEKCSGLPRSLKFRRRLALSREPERLHQGDSRLAVLGVLAAAD